MFCRHKFGKVEGEYQYCKKCGKAISVPCNHKFEKLHVFPVTWIWGKTCAYIYVSRCVKCGEIKRDEVK
jgi:hypothetical protein